MYKAIIIEDAEKTKIMATEIEATANEQELNGYKLITAAITKAQKAILVFYKQ